MNTPPSCPLCGSTNKKSVAERLFFCKSCKCVFNDEHKTLSYDTDYFTSEYLKQYGKTYEDDFRQIYASAELRLKRIAKLAGASSGSILDIGCALGFFLKAARDFGYSRCEGVEISLYASEYCKDKFGFKVRREPFEEIYDAGIFDVVTAWYFLEHCREPVKAVNKIYASLKIGGVIALAVPSAYGPMFRRNIQLWIRTRPKDHRIDFTPSSLRRLLLAAGFCSIKIYGAGFHPERLINKSSVWFKPFSLIYYAFSKLTAYSDTIEAYAVKQ